LWPRTCRSILQIKLFAIDLLSDLFGPKFGAFDPREIEFFVCNIAYVIQRELDLLSPPDLNYIALTQDGVFGAGKGKSPTQSNNNGVEHLIRIDLDV